MNNEGGGGGLVKAWEATVRKSQAAAKKRANIIFTTMSVAHAADDDDSAATDSPSSGAEIALAEKVLSNGDFYTGQWADGLLPHGHGKYLWTDGCMYVGEWVRGKTTGKGRFSWPSGAAYEGEFKTGFMDGKGTYTGSSGDTYRGSWLMNLKHGHGTQSYSNGDHFDGQWRRGSQDGHGRYQWNHGNHYIGHWRNGVINGNGTMIWGNGNRYDGFWEDGYPKGNGTFRWADGSFYVGLWSKDPKEHCGTFYPSSGGSSPDSNADFDWDPQEVFTVDLSECRVCAEEKVSIFPSQKMPNLPGITGSKPRRRSVDGRVSGVDAATRPYVLDCSEDVGTNGFNERVSGVGRDGEEGFVSLQVEDFDSREAATPRIQPVKKQGETLSKGHKNYELMLNLQLGIRHSVGRPAPETSVDLRASAFDPKEKVWTKFPPEGSKQTPPHQSCEFKWKDYCPLVFRTLRKLFKVDAADYMMSICGNDALRELSSPGKSGSFFYLTHDDRYMIKTMRKSEVKVLQRMLPAYYTHVQAFDNTLVTKFFGLHCVKLTGAAQKKSWFQEFCRQVDRDSDFLEQERIMDYSLLVGVHFPEALTTRESPLSEAHTPGSRTPTGNRDCNSDVAARCLSRVEMDQLHFDPAGWAAVNLGVNTPARVEQTMRIHDCEPQLIGEPTGELYDVILFFGIIDILQDYDISKKLEHTYKSFQYDPTSISSVDPKQYSKRFRDFIFRVFTDDT